ncbi:hypothetical protein A2W67_03660 [Candidatus Nomurabacteria bacterium RIFCSPLOWO2_02_40_28]|uniref:Uncharacterized protein n=2 Tax=Candidatus Nomuraibacteriota TaxID=1752729 RepID=A0A837HS40_9BACT|nr:MAG: hypothetical protein UT27_C0004G0032 [Candidatus Nomurabacteria bacterium GW2011_GWD2_39_12]KKR20894.1 MAG: hypothetical protein UT51_C0001G0032 [Candidatus Nomurabacteria bacterium GW2011_GWC2_39_41]KKR37227.1 MAG: hypothetical protein UT70_C0002G0063 [Candidatus Nomurabacteria bacterium GW2011_GWE2_40_10]KKR38843.1 MAG: hypothetical protein UT73_C0001G0031 [Candidatus Nomurabacteria bacterium GW2011_GWB1_40_11]KKR40041.1 MAG: hypothetical protein UT74_C0003G0032 [Parcubacteria group b
MQEEKQKELEKVILWKTIEGISVNENGNICFILGGGEVLHFRAENSRLIVEFNGKEILKT